MLSFLHFQKLVHPITFFLIPRVLSTHEPLQIQPMQHTVTAMRLPLPISRTHFSQFIHKSLTRLPIISLHRNIHTSPQLRSLLLPCKKIQHSLHQLLHKQRNKSLHSQVDQRRVQFRPIIPHTRNFMPGTIRPKG